VVVGLKRVMRVPSLLPHGKKVARSVG
jgi:hypothetical protein